MKKLVSKQVLRYGEWKHAGAPNGKLVVDKKFVTQLVDNFKKSPFVPIYRGHQSDEKAAENPELIVAKNISSLDAKDDGLFATFEIDESELEKYADVSAGIQNEGEDHESGNGIGAVLRHIALVPNPYIKGLNPFTSLSDRSFNILLSEIMEEPKQTEEQAEVEVVTTTEAKVEDEVVTEATPETEVTEVIPEVETPKVEEEVIEEPSEDLKVKLAEAQETIRKLQKDKSESDARSLYTTYLAEGKIVPSMENEFMELATASTEMILLSDGSKKDVGTLIKNLFSKMPTLVSLSEKGTNLEEKTKTESGYTPEFENDRRTTYFGLSENKNKTELDFQEYLKSNKAIFSKYANNN